jgi:hypothetical protein
MNKAFVFAVCGDLEHIDTLHYALKILVPKTNCQVIVVTDSRRNAAPINHNYIVDIPTPDYFNHHQASIFLKTGLHKFLPKGNIYTYLDSDIIAFGSNIDDIFNQFIAPIRFAPDHCNMPLFSPSAVNCGCKEHYDSFIAKINIYMDELDPLRLSKDPLITLKRDTLKKHLLQIVANKPKLLLHGLRYLSSWPVFKLNKEFYLNRKTNVWSTQNGDVIMTNIRGAKLAKQFNLRYNYLTMNIKFDNGKSIWVNSCFHLQDKIMSKFNVKITNKYWQHWNGGVFIFNDKSHEFLENWHQFTLEIFKDPEWKTRDQGTLIATVWKFGLQNHPVLDKKWNFICDYNNHLLQIRNRDNAFTQDGNNYVAAEFLHVYHHFGDTNWPFWNTIEKLTHSD